MSAAPFTFVIVGAGHAGVELAFALRKEAAQGRILLVDAGGALPYHRPPLSKQYLTAGEDSPPTRLRPAQAYADHGIELKLGAPVTAIDRPLRRIHIDGAEPVEYDTLILATGAQARPLELPLPDGPLAPGVLHTLRTLDDARRLRNALRAGSAVAIVGGGYIGLEVAAVAAASGMRADVVERQEQLLARSASADLATFLRTAHASSGVRFHLGATLRAARPGRDGFGVQLELDTRNGARCLHADLVLAGIGATPRTRLAEAAGLAVSNGILVDETLRTGDPAIYAIGDCAAWRRSPESSPVRFESIPAALAQAQALAARLCGNAAPGTATPWFWSDQGNLKVQIAGTRDHDDILVRRTDDPPSLSLFYVSNGRLAGVESVNNPKGFLQARRLIGEGAPMDAALLL